MLEEEIAKIHAGLEALKVEMRRLFEKAGPPERPMTVPEVAAYLNLSETTVYRKLEEGSLPGHKVGKRWYCFRREIDEWLSSHEHKSKASIDREAERWVLHGSTGTSRPYRRGDISDLKQKRP